MKFIVTSLNTVYPIRELNKIILYNFMEILSFIFSLLAFVVSSIIAIKSWMKNRNIYNLEFCEFLPDKIREPGNIEIRDKLNSGDYTILHAEYRHGGYNILLGKLKK